MPFPKEKLYTIEDIYALPDGKRGELIDGKLYMMAPPSRIHQKILQEFSRVIGNYISGKGGSVKSIPLHLLCF